MLQVQIYNSAKFTKLLTAKCLEKTIYLWSLRYEHEGRVYELWLERKLYLQPEFEKRDKELLNIINFYWLMKVTFTKKMISVLMKSTQIIILYFTSVYLKKLQISC
jgi:hypothetical protein